MKIKSRECPLLLLIIIYAIAKVWPRFMMWHEICRQGQGWSYRWYRIQEFFGIDPDRKDRLYYARLFRHNLK